MGETSTEEILKKPASKMTKNELALLADQANKQLAQLPELKMPPLEKKGSILEKARASQARLDKEMQEGANELNLTSSADVISQAEIDRMLAGNTVPTEQKVMPPRRAKQPVLSK